MARCRIPVHNLQNPHWLHHGTLHFVTQLPFQYPGNGMAILREDAAYELATKRW